MKKLLLFLTVTCLLFSFNKVNAQDEIRNVSSPDPITQGATEVITVDYTAYEQRDIVVNIQSTQDWTNYGSTRVTVPAGTSSVDIDLKVAASIPPAVDAYKVGAYIAPVGGNYPTLIHELSQVDIDVIEATEPIDELITLTAPTTVSPGQVVAVSVEYEATQQRDITLVLQENGGSWTQYGTETATVEAGQGTVTIDLPVSPEIPIVAGVYKIGATLVPVGGEWPDRLDEITQTNVSAAISNSIISEQEEPGINVFPNPAHSISKIKSETTIKNISLTSLSGELMINEKVGSNEYQLNLSSYSKGLYLLSVTNDNGTSITKLVIN